LTYLSENCSIYALGRREEMEHTFLTSDDMDRGTSVHIDECFNRCPGPVDIAKCLGKQWVKQPIKTTIIVAFGVGMTGISLLYIPIKALARRSSSAFIRKYLA